MSVVINTPKCRFIFFIWYFHFNLNISIPPFFALVCWHSFYYITYARERENRIPEKIFAIFWSAFSTSFEPLSAFRFVGVFFRFACCDHSEIFLFISSLIPWIVWVRYFALLFYSLWCGVRFIKAIIFLLETDTRLCLVVVSFHCWRLSSPPETFHLRINCNDSNAISEQRTHSIVDVVCECRLNPVENGNSIRKWRQTKTLWLKWNGFDVASSLLLHFFWMFDRNRNEKAQVPARLWLLSAHENTRQYSILDLLRYVHNPYKFEWWRLPNSG